MQAPRNARNFITVLPVIEWFDFTQAWAQLHPAPPILALGLLPWSLRQPLRSQQPLYPLR